MAQVNRTTDMQPEIDYHLDYQFQSWQGIPEYAGWWPEMEASEKEVFHLEWVGITQSRLGQLQRWAEQGCLTPAQQARYEELLQLIERHRPTLEWLLEH